MEKGKGWRRTAKSQTTSAVQRCGVEEFLAAPSSRAETIFLSPPASKDQRRTIPAVSVLDLLPITQLLSPSLHRDSHSNQAVTSTCAPVDAMPPRTPKVTDRNLQRAITLLSRFATGTVALTGVYLYVYGWDESEQIVQAKRDASTESTK